MPAFNIAAAVIPREARRTYKVPGLPGFELELAPMTKANRAYWSEFLTIVTAWHASGGVDEELDEASEVRYRRRDAELMAKHVVTGWAGVTNAAGEPVPFTSQAARDFLLELATTEGAEHLFDGIRAFAKEPSNFTGGALAASKALAGNSAGG